MSPATRRDIPHGCTGQGLSHGDRGGYAGSEPVEFLGPWAGLGSSRGVPQHQGPLEAGGALGPRRGHRGHFGHGKGGVWSMHEPWSWKPSEPLGFASHKAELPRGAHKAVRAWSAHAGAGHFVHLSIRRRHELSRTKAKPGQSCCSAGEQPQRPRPQTPAAMQSHGQEERQDEGCAALTCASPPPISTHGHHTWSKHTEHPPALRTNPSLRLQRHSTLQLPRPRWG